MKVPKNQTRTLTLDVRAADDDGVIPAVISTDAPCERHGYREILQHTPDAVDLSRAPLPLIESHDSTRVNVGVVDKLQLVGGKLRGLVRLGKSARARELLENIRAGIVTGLSIGYQISKFREKDGDVIATRWMPYEASVVAIPADLAAGFFRSKDTMSSVEITRDERDEAGRVKAISAAAHQFKQHDLGQRAIAEGWSVDKFQRSILDSYASQPTQTQSDLGLTEAEQRKFSMVKLLRHLSNPTDKRARNDAGFELEVCGTSTRGEGVTIPMQLLGQRGLSVAGTSTGSALVPTDHIGFIDMLRARMFISEAGAQFLTGLSGNVAIPRQSGATTAYWVAEDSDITASDATFDQVTLSPHTVGARQEISRKLLLQSTPDVEALIRSDFAAVLAREIDRVAIEGAPDTTAGANEPRGIINTVGVGSVAGGTNGAAPTRDHLIDLERELEIDNVGMARPAYAFSPKVKAKLAKTALDTGSGRFVLESPTEVNGHRYFSSTLVPDDLTKGSASGVCSAIIMADWSQLAVGVWDQLTILADPYSGSASGRLRLVAFADIDCALRQPAAAAVMLDALTA